MSYLSGGGYILPPDEGVEGTGNIRVLIGPENVAEELKDSSVVIASYDAGDNTKGIIGVVGMLVLTLFPLAVPAGADGFLQRGPVWPSSTFYFWTFVQATGSLIGVGFMIRAYQITDAGRASVLEYIILPASAFWTWVIWGKGLEPLAVLGMVLIVIAGSIIALRAKA